MSESGKKTDSMLPQINRRCVVVTGGSRGLGLAIVRCLLQEGYDVATCSRLPSPELDRTLEDIKPERIFWRTCSIGDASQEADFFARSEEWAGGRGIYGLINNAGVGV